MATESFPLDDSVRMILFRRPEERLRVCFMVVSFPSSGNCLARRTSELWGGHAGLLDGLRTAQLFRPKVSRLAGHRDLRAGPWSGQEADHNSICPTGTACPYYGTTDSSRICQRCVSVTARGNEARRFIAMTRAGSGSHCVTHRLQQRAEFDQAWAWRLRILATKCRESRGDPIT